MIDVIERAGTTKGTCCYHFPAKSSPAAAVRSTSKQYRPQL